MMLQNNLLTALANMHRQRQEDFVGSMLWHQNNRATEYFSRWIELKETKGESS